MDYRYEHEGREISVRVTGSGPDYAVEIDGRVYEVSAGRLAGGELLLTVDGVRLTAHLAADGSRRWVALGASRDPQPFVLSVPQARRRARRGRAGEAAHDRLEAQMPGLVREVLARAGERVERGQPLVVLEAMKMEIRVSAPQAGVVEQVLVEAGQTVERGQVLVDLLPTGSPE